MIETMGRAILQWPTLSAFGVIMLMVGGVLSGGLVYDAGVSRGERNLMISGHGLTIEGWLNLGDVKHHIAVSSCRWHGARRQPRRLIHAQAEVVL
jgi:hypothetical protein